MTDEEAFIKNVIEEQNVKTGDPIFSNNIKKRYYNIGSPSNLDAAFDNMVKNGELKDKQGETDYILTQKGHIAIFGY